MVEADMATTTYGAVPVTAAATKPGFWARLVERFIEGRSREAEKQLRAHLLAFDAETLARLGYDRDALIRAGVKHYV
jgi:hypothetical protein